MMVSWNLTAASSEAFPSVEVDAGKHDDNAMGNSLHHAYLLAKKRWRRFTGSAAAAVPEVS